MKIFTVTNLLRTLLPAAVAVAVAIGAGCGSSNRPSALVGQWIFADGHQYKDIESVELFSDGTGVVDGVSLTWKVENKRLMLLTSVLGVAADYKVSGNVVVLTYDDGKSATFVKKEKLGEYKRKKAVGMDLTSNGDIPSNLRGHWVEVDNNHDYALFEDGTGLDGGDTISWKVENKRIVFQSDERMIFDYKIHGYELILFSGEGDTLRFVKNENLKEIEAEKVREVKEARETAERMKQSEEKRFEKISTYFTDSRNGRKYRAVKIGGKTWMAQNLNYQTGNSWCYGNDNSNCEKYGRLYDCNTAKTVCPAGWHLPSNQDWEDLKKAVGDTVIGGKKLKAKYGWAFDWCHELDEVVDEQKAWFRVTCRGVSNGTDEYGFSALPGGARDLYGHRGSLEYQNVDVGAFWWSGTRDKYGLLNVWSVAGEKLFKRLESAEEMVRIGNAPTIDYTFNFGYSVRCVEGGAEADARQRVTQEGVLGIVSGQIKNKSGDGGVGRKGGSGYGSGFGGGGGGVDDILSGLMGGGGGGLELKKKGELTVSSPDFLKNGKVTGARSRESINRVIMQNIAALRYAYNKRLREKPEIAGEIKVKFSIDEFGKVISAQIVGSTMDDSELETTVVSRVNSWNFEKIDKPGDVTTVTYPFVFSQ